MTDVYEGSLIRMFRRLEELLLQMVAASKVMGSEELEKKFEAALALIKRGSYLSPTFTKAVQTRLTEPAFAFRYRCGPIPLPVSRGSTEFSYIYILNVVL